VEQRQWTEEGGGDVKSFQTHMCYAKSLHVRQVLRCRIFHGGVNIGIGKGYADHSPEDGPAV
jgi:ribosomal protein L27